MGTQFDGKTVIVTGASAGVGAATARAFARRGARLVLVARGAAALEERAEELRAGAAEVLVTAMDVSDTAAGAELLDRTQRHFGGVHVLVNNAGFHQRGPVADVEANALAQMIDVNLRAPIVLSRLALPLLKQSGGGAIVNVASLAGCVPVPGSAAYSAAKFGLRAFSLAMAEELRGSGIQVGVVSPGPIATGFILDDIDQVTDLTFSQPMSTAEQVADAIVELAGGTWRETKMPAHSGRLTTLAYLFPSIARRMRPWLEKKGRGAKERYRRGMS